MAALASLVRSLSKFSPFSTRFCALQQVRNDSSTGIPEIYARKDVTKRPNSYALITSDNPPKTYELPKHEKREKQMREAWHDLWYYNADKYADAWMKRDAKRRRHHKEFSTIRTRYLALKRAYSVLPKEILNEVDIVFRKEVHFPRTTSNMHLTSRCQLSSRGRGVVYRWRLSRFMFRNMVDYNTIAGLQRAIW